MLVKHLFLVLLQLALSFALIIPPSKIFDKLFPSDSSSEHSLSNGVKTDPSHAPDFGRPNEPHSPLELIKPQNQILLETWDGKDMLDKTPMPDPPRIPFTAGSQSSNITIYLKLVGNHTWSDHTAGISTTNLQQIVAGNLSVGNISSVILLVSLLLDPPQDPAKSELQGILQTFDAELLQEWFGRHGEILRLVLKSNGATELARVLETMDFSSTLGAPRSRNTVLQAQLVSAQESRVNDNVVEVRLIFQLVTPPDLGQLLRRIDSFAPARTAYLLFSDKDGRNSGFVTLSGDKEQVQTAERVEFDPKDLANGLIYSSLQKREDPQEDVGEYSAMLYNFEMLDDSFSIENHADHYVLKHRIFEDDIVPPLGLLRLSARDSADDDITTEDTLSQATQDTSSEESDSEAEIEQEQDSSMEHEDPDIRVAQQQVSNTQKEEDCVLVTWYNVFHHSIFSRPKFCHV